MIKKDTKKVVLVTIERRVFYRNEAMNEDEWGMEKKVKKKVIKG